MALVVNVQPSDACGRPLPVRCRIRVSRNTNLDAEGFCEADQAQLSLTVPVSNATYVVFLSARPFGDSSVFVQVDQVDATARVLCLASAKRVTPIVPTYAELPEELQVVLERSQVLDIRPDREMGEATPPSRSTPARAAGAERSLPSRTERPVRDGERRWQLLDREAQAGLLNLFAKMRSFTLSAQHRSAWSYVVELRAVARDRILAVVESALKPATEQSSVFHDARELLPVFHTPPKHFSRAGSWKSDEPFGNLQFSFFESQEDRNEIWVDADVDDAAGIGHAEQVVRNESRKIFKKIFRFIPGLPEGTTHPYDIHQILVFHQKTHSKGTDAIGAFEASYHIRVDGTPAGYAIPPR